MSVRQMSLLLLAVIAPSLGSAADVHINDSAVQNFTALDPVMGAKYRLDTTNWDMALHSGTGTNNPAPAPQDFVQQNLGNALSGVTFQFELKHIAGQGFALKMTTGPSSSTLSWGALALGGTNVATLQRWTGSGLDGIDHSPTDAFNVLVIEARAQRNVDANGPEPDSQLTVSNLSFTSPTLTTTGSFIDVSTNENAAGSVWTPPGMAVQDGRYWQNLYSSENLAVHDWTLSATVSGTALTNNPVESLRFEVTAVAAIPEPETYMTLIAGIALLGVVWRRRAREARSARA